MAKVKDWINTYKGNLNVSNLISSSEVENYFIIHYGSFESVGDLLSLNESWEFYKKDSQDNLLLTVNAMQAEYNPIENYSMTETETESNSNNTSENERSTSEINTTTQNNTTTTPNTKTTENSILKTYPFDDDENAHPKESQENTVSESGTTTMSSNGTQGNTGTDTNAKEIAENESKSRNLTRSGNIGVTTSQQMIESEINLRKKLLFHDYLAKFAVLNLFYFGGDD